MDRRSFLSYGATATASLFARGAFHQAWAQDLGCSSPSAVVRTTAGRVRGITRDKVSAFFGIPYGASTADARRFMPPSKPDSWTGVRDALQFGPRSPQGPSALIPEVAAVDRREVVERRLPAFERVDTRHRERPQTRHGVAAWRRVLPRIGCFHNL